MNSIDEYLATLAFPKAQLVRGRASIADLFSSKRRCGIYVLHFANGDYYAGQAVDVTRRFVQHSKQHTDIERISFKRVGRVNLNTEERAVIKALELNGYTLRNIQFTTIVHGESDFDLIMPLEDQEKWLNDLDYMDLTGPRVVDPVLRGKYHKKFVDFESMPFISDVIRVLREYVKTGLPAVLRGEISFWNCSCLPVRKNDWVIYSRINMGWQTVFEANLSADENQPVFMWYLTKSLTEEAFGVSLSKLATDRPNLWGFEEYPNLAINVRKSSLVQGGSDQVFLEVEGLTNALDLIHDPDTLAAVRLFNLNLMKKGPSPWGKFHCLDLADKLIE